MKIFYYGGRTTSKILEKKKLNSYLNLPGGYKIKIFLKGKYILYINIPCPFKVAGLKSFLTLVFSSPNKLLCVSSFLEVLGVGPLSGSLKTFDSIRLTFDWVDDDGAAGPKILLPPPPGGLSTLKNKVNCMK